MVRHSNLDLPRTSHDAMFDIIVVIVAIIIPFKMCIVILTAHLAVDYVTFVVDAAVLNVCLSVEG